MHSLLMQAQELNRITFGNDATTIRDLSYLSSSIRFYISVAYQILCHLLESSPTIWLCQRKNTFDRGPKQYNIFLCAVRDVGQTESGSPFSLPFTIRRRQKLFKPPLIRKLSEGMDFNINSSYPKYSLTCLRITRPFRLW